ncbi:MAG: helix-turn-helix domain-containing protein [Mycobacteriaceae bacterium]|nr:helix-turn-helix domain-containing protein [Mycobacteriaceae bacterium]MBV9638856.1 helix-turn-helix domain-containing protein [Mycobacteriaceae bacterium]
MRQIDVGFLLPQTHSHRSSHNQRIDTARMGSGCPSDSASSTNTIASALGVSRATVYRVLAEDADD